MNPFGVVNLGKIARFYVLSALFHAARLLLNTAHDFRFFMCLRRIVNTCIKDEYRISTLQISRYFFISTICTGKPTSRNFYS